MTFQGVAGTMPACIEPPPVPLQKISNQPILVQILSIAKDSKRILARISGRNEHQSLPREWRPSLCKACGVQSRVTGLSPSKHWPVPEPDGAPHEIPHHPVRRAPPRWCHVPHRTALPTRLIRDVEHAPWHELSGGDAVDGCALPCLRERGGG